MTEPSNNDLAYQNVIAHLADDYMKEKRRKRRWGIFFKSLFFVWLGIILISVLSNRTGVSSESTSKPHTALIDIRGPIFDKGPANADNLARSLSKAYKDKGTKGILLRINSPGGSPVQASYAYNEIRRQKKLHPDIKIYAVCTDACASAAYYIAAAADEIYANPSSLVGSIGVLYNGFGFVGALQKLGVERRLITAGKNKGFMDPFSPVSNGQKGELMKMLTQIHHQFEQDVIAGRGKRLSNKPEVFSGLFWTGQQAKKLGLIDGFGSAGTVARDIIKQEKIIDYTKRPNYLERIARRIGLAFSENLSSTLGLRAPGVQSRVDL